MDMLQEELEQGGRGSAEVLWIWDCGSAHTFLPGWPCCCQC